MIIQAEDITLRAIEIEDLEMLREMVNDPALENCVLGFSFPVSKFSQQKWYEETHLEKNNQKWIIEYNKTAVGVVYLSQIDWRNRNAQIGIKLHSNTPKRQGIGYKSILMLEEFVFGQLNLYRLEVKILESNLRSKKLFEKLGWRMEGILRCAHYGAFEFHNIYIFSLLVTEFLENQKDICNIELIIDN